MEAAVGSNMWTAAPDHSAAGHAMLLINPHQPFFGPGQWYEGQVHSDEGWDMTGASFFGSGFPTIGHNEYLGWSHTVNDPDITDTYIEKFDDGKNPLNYHYGDGYKAATEWTDSIKVTTDKGLETKTYRFRKTHHGPIVAVRDGKPLALRMSRLEEGGQIEEWYMMSKSKSLKDFKAAMSRIAIPMFNAMYADREGNIFYVYNGAVPRRLEKFDWTKPVDGSNPETEWNGYHPFEDLPQLLNPKSGFMQNCNQTPFTTTSDGSPKKENYPSYMTREIDNARAQISRRLLSSQPKFTFDEWARLAFDTRILEAEIMIPEIAAEWDKLKESDAARAAKLADAVADLKAWDHVASFDSSAMTLFSLWFEQYFRLRATNPKAEWNRIQALEVVANKLTTDWGTWKVAWGEVNRLQRIQSGGELEKFDDAKPSLPVAGAAGPLGVVFNFYTQALKGEKRRYGVAGTSFVSVVEFGPQVEARSLLQFGESADPSSPHYLDQGRLYSKREFKPAWFTPADIKAHSERSYHPGQTPVRKAS
jgi:penicillin amidase